MGALISKEHLAKVKGYVELAEKDGATIACGREELNLDDTIKNVQPFCTALSIHCMFV